MPPDGDDERAGVASQATGSPREECCVQLVPHRTRTRTVTGIARTERSTARLVTPAESGRQPSERFLSSRFDQQLKRGGLPAKHLSNGLASTCGTRSGPTGAKLGSAFPPLLALAGLPQPLGYVKTYPRPPPISFGDGSLPLLVNALRIARSSRR